MLLLNGCSFVWGDELEGYDNNPPTHHPHTFAHKLADKLGVEYVNLARCGNCNEKIFRDVMTYLTTEEKPSHLMVLWSDPIRKEQLLEVYDESEPNVPRQISMTQWHENRWQDLELSMSPTIARNFSRHEIYMEHTRFKRAKRVVDSYFSVFATPITHQLTMMLAIQKLADEMGIKVVQGVFHTLVRTQLKRFTNRVDRSKDTCGEQLVDWREWVSDTLGTIRPECQLGLVEGATLWDKQGDRPLKKEGHTDEQSHTEYAEYLFEVFKNDTKMSLTDLIT